MSAVDRPNFASVSRSPASIKTDQILWTKIYENHPSPSKNLLKSIQIGSFQDKESDSEDEEDDTARQQQMQLGQIREDDERILRFHSTFHGCSSINVEHLHRATLMM